MTLPRLWAFLAVGLPVLAALIANLPSVDLAYHLRAGAEILAGHGIPTVDTWTFTAAGTSWTDQQWGAQVILAAVYQVAGWTGLVVLRAALIGVIFGCLFAIGVRRGLGIRRAAWLTLAAFLVSAVALGLRPQLIGMALFAVVLLLVTDRRAHPGRLWAVPIIVLVWANIHGSFFLGPVVLGLAWLEDLHDRVPGARRLLVAVASALAACVTPFGPLVWAYALGLSTNAEVTARITEWQPTSLRTIPGILFFGSALAVVALIARRGRHAVADARLAGGLLPHRGLCDPGRRVVAAGRGRRDRRGAGDRSGPGSRPPRCRRVAADATAQPRRRRRDRRGRHRAAAGLAAAGPGSRRSDRCRRRGSARHHRPSAPDGAAGRPAVRPQPWGSWFEFALPDLPVAIDSRIELFPASTWDGYETVVDGGDGWESRLRGWGVTVAVVDEDHSALRDRLTAAGWQTAYTDADGSVLTAPDR